MSIEQYFSCGEAYGISTEVMREMIEPVMRYKPSGDQNYDAPNFSVTGNIAALPTDMDWPCWNASSYCAAQGPSLLNRFEEGQEIPAKYQRRIDHFNAMAQNPLLPLRMIAQLDLQECADIEIGVTLPTSGVLSFFAEFNEGIACLGRAMDDPPWRIFWFPEMSELTWREAPFDFPSHHTTLKPQQGWALTEGAADLFAQNNTTESFGDLVEALCDLELLGGLRLGGWPLRRQSRDIRASITARNAGYDAWTPPIGDDITPNLNWRPLLQYATDFQNPTQWSGVASFWFQADQSESKPWKPGQQQNIELFFEA